MEHGSLLVDLVAAGAESVTSSPQVTTTANTSASAPPPPPCCSATHEAVRVATNNATTTTTDASTSQPTCSIADDGSVTDPTTTPMDQSVDGLRRGGTVLWGLCRVCSAALSCDEGERLSRSWLVERSDDRITSLLVALDRHTLPARMTWRSPLAADVLRNWIPRLASVLSLLVMFNAHCTNAYDRESIAPGVWVCLTRQLCHPLARDNVLMNVMAAARGVQRFNPLVTEFPTAEHLDNTQCRVCLERPADTAVVWCGHVFCHVCLRVLHTCPVCRDSVQGKIRLYF